MLNHNCQRCPDCTSARSIRNPRSAIRNPQFFRFSLSEPIRQVDLKPLAGPSRLAAGNLVLHVHQAEIERVAGIKAGASGKALAPLAFVEDVVEFAVKLEHQPVRDFRRELQYGPKAAIAVR